MIKNIYKNTLILTLSFFVFFWVSFADNQKKLDLEPNRKLIFEFISNYVIWEIPESYKYINLYYKDLKNIKNNKEMIQKIVYTWVLPNDKVKLNLDKKLNAYQFFYMINYLTWYDFINDENKSILQNRFVKVSDLLMVKEILNEDDEKIQANLDRIDYYFSILKDEKDREKLDILLDVYNTLLTEHIDSEKLDKDKMLYSSIEWIANWTNDEYSVYFPPVESKNFEENLSWEFEWIWAYVEMSKPWILLINSPLPDSPAKKAWLKWWDIILKVDDFEITKDISLNDAVWKIKWIINTSVILTILRWEEVLKIEVIRWKVIVKDVDYEEKWEYFYIHIKNFWDKVFDEFNNAINEFKKSKKSKLIIDLRDNPGWYLDKVASMLDLFVPNGEKTVVVKYKNFTDNYFASNIEKLDLSNIDTYILINSQTASASEIMAWTLKDYFKNIKIIWEKSFWKWSVQTMRKYFDWSMLKYTNAKWYTWKTLSWIDKIWITPDIEVKLDVEKLKSWMDSQLNYILNK